MRPGGGVGGRIGRGYGHRRADPRRDAGARPAPPPGSSPGSCPRAAAAATRVQHVGEQLVPELRPATRDEGSPPAPGTAGWPGRGRRRPGTGRPRPPTPARPVGRTPAGSDGLRGDPFADHDGACGEIAQALALRVEQAGQDGGDAEEDPDLDDLETGRGGRRDGTWSRRRRRARRAGRRRTCPGCVPSSGSPTPRGSRG